MSATSGEINEENIQRAIEGDRSVSLTSQECAIAVDRMSAEGVLTVDQAMILGFSAKTIERWRRGTSEPSGRPGTGKSRNPKKSASPYADLTTDELRAVALRFDDKEVREAVAVLDGATKKLKAVLDAAHAKALQAVADAERQLTTARSQLARLPANDDYEEAAAS
jgi:hypothetical protein